MSSEQISTSIIKQANNIALPKLSYSVKEATRITGLGRTTLWKAINEGRLRCFRAGRRVLFSLDHLMEFLKTYEK
jgi:excisionase family DNA binding protein